MSSSSLPYLQDVNLGQGVNLVELICLLAGLVLDGRAGWLVLGGRPASRSAVMLSDEFASAFLRRCPASAGAAARLP